MRAARKQAGLKQSDLAHHLYTSQGAYSKMENGKAVPSSPQWAEFCRVTGIPVQSLLSGEIDFPTQAKISNAARAGAFKIPPRFSFEQGSKIRALKFFLHFAKDQLGEDAILTLLQQWRLDPDYFVNLDNQLNIQFLYDLLEVLIRHGALTPANLPRLSAKFSEPAAHGALLPVYMSAHGVLKRLSVIIAHSDRYDCNYSYRTEHESAARLEIAVAPRPHLSEFRADSVIHDVICRYKKTAILQIAEALNHGAGSVTLHETQCQFRGADRCIYRVAI